MSYNAYQKVQQRTESAAEVEYRLFTQVTRALVAAENQKPSQPDFIKAIDWNRRMWSTLSSDCSAEGNGLPKELRASIISLAIWVSKHSTLVMRAEESIDDLIQINKTIMEGLGLQIKKTKNLSTTAPQNQPAASGQQASQQAFLNNFKPKQI